MNFSIDSKFFHFMTKVGDLMILSCLWLVCSLPVFTLGASTAALYYSVVKIVREDGGGGTFRAFFHSFKDNFIQGTVITILMLLGTFAVTAIGTAVSNRSTAEDTLPTVYFVYIVLLMFAIAWLHYLISYIARFQAPLPVVLKNCLMILLMHMPMSISMMLMFIVVAMLFILTIPASSFLLLLLPGTYAWISSFILERIYNKYRNPEENEDEDHQ